MHTPMQLMQLDGSLATWFEEGFSELVAYLAKWQAFYLWLDNHGR